MRSSPASEVTQPVDVLAPDAYKWALILVQAEPTYLRLRTLAGPYTFTVPASGKDQKNTNPMPPEPPTVNRLIINEE
ncbi:MAG TPA: hypothetical protein GX400_11845 [Chloroflexi bacterium]|nr:hypothetical protein [Chloroflexota bacterium]